ncbi:MAG: hypothetical protein J6L03_06410 [Bacteroidaceae bacterium]|nr:hypothetical protein [Bacteroidaceae bacterium]
MKRILAFVFSILAVVSIAQPKGYNDKLQAIQEYPRTVVKEARVALDEAVKGHKSPEMVDALMLLSAAQLLLDSDSIESVIAEIERVMNHCSDEVDRSVVALYLCDVYNTYLTDNYYKYARTSYIKGNSNIATWNVRNFYDKIDSLQHVALQPVRALQKTSISHYQSIIGVEGYDGDKMFSWVKKFYPTMYDFVASVIYEANVARREQKEHPDSVVEALLDDVIRYHEKTGKKAPAMMWNLKRLQYNYRMTQESNSYLQALDELISRYARHDFVVEAVITRYTHTMPETQHETLSEYNALKQWIARYPRYYRIGCLQAMCADLSAASVAVSMPHAVYPADSIVADIRYRNVDSLECVLWKSDIMHPLQGVPYNEVEKWQWEKVERKTIACKGVDFDFYDAKALFIPQSPGLYRMTIASSTHKDEALFVVTPYMLLTVESTPAESFAILVDSKSGKPVVGEEIVLTNRAGEVLQQSISDINGVCRYERPVVAGTYYLHLADVKKYPFMQNLSFAYPKTARANVEARVFTDRRLYRPEQTFHFSAIVYRMDSSLRQVLANVNVKAKLYDNGGNEVWNGNFVTDKYGSLHGEISLPEKASLGNWRLSVQGDNFYAVQSIDVIEYKRPQFAVECKDVESVYSYGDSVQVSGNAMTYSGAAVAFARVDYVVRQYAYLYGEGRVVAQGNTSTSAGGDFDFSFVTAEPEDMYARIWGTRYVAEVTVTSATGESQQGETLISVPGVGVKFTTNIPDKVCRDEVNTFAISVVNGSGVVQQLPYTLSLYRTLAEGVGSKEYIRQGVALWHADGEGCDSNLILPYDTMQSGTYRLMMSTYMQDGVQVTDSVDFVCYSHADVHPPVAAELWLPTDRFEAVNGDIIHIAVGSALHNAMLYYFISDGNNSIEYTTVALDNSMTSVKLPFDASCDDVVQVIFVLVYDNKVYRRLVTVSRKQPDMRLTITPTTFRDKTRPGNRETWQFTVRDALGRPVDALFMAEMYDASLDALRAHSWQFNPRFTPYAQYMLSVDYFWYLTSTDYAYINYRNEYANAQYISGISPILRSYLMSYHGVMGGAVAYRSMAVNSVMTKETMDVDMIATEESVLDANVTAPDVPGALENTASARSESLAVIDYRDDMDETAFFYPHLVTDKDGNVSVEFTVPESNTTWNFLSLAVTPQLYNGMYTASVVSSKPLMVQPNMPRFVRQGDKIVLSTAVHNMTDEDMQGDVIFTLYNPDDDSVIVVESKQFTAQAQASTSVQFAVSLPDTLSFVGVRIGAQTAMYSDGEQHLLAVLPSTEVVTESKPFYLSPAVCDTTIVFDAMREKMERDSVRNMRVTLEYCDNPVWYAVTALPSLAQPKDKSVISLMASLYANVVATGIVAQNLAVAQALAEWSRGEGDRVLVSQLEKNEELKQLLLSTTPWALEAATATEQLRQIASLLDESMARRMVHETTTQLRDEQQSDGGWPWFNGMRSSFTITLNVVAGLSRIMQWGDIGNTEQLAMMKIDALRYLDAEYLRRNKEYPEQLDYQDLCYLYVRSATLDVPMTSELRSLCNQQLDTIASQWYKLDEIEKAYAAVALYSNGKKQVAENIINSLREYAVVSSVQGMYWPNNRSNTFYRNSAVQVHCAIYEAFAMVSPRTDESDNMRQWLLLQKQTQEWDNVPSTLDAVNILLASGSRWLLDNKPATIAWGNAPLPETTQAEQIMGYEKYVREGEMINPSDATVCVKEHSNKPSWGAIYWQYSDDVNNIDSYATDELSIERNYYVERGSGLVPIESTAIKVGDIVTVRMTITAMRDMQYMALVDSRPACFEPQKQLPQYKYSQGVWYYEVPGDAGTAIYIEHLPRGVYVIEYNVYADRLGTYHSGIATLQSYYAPQFTSHTSGTTITVSQ